MSYWKYQSFVDVALAALATAVFWFAPTIGLPILFSGEPTAVAVAARTWVAPTLTLLGMMSATTAFLFTVIDRDEFALLRKVRSESQLWRVFSQNILWLGVAAIYCGVITFWAGEDQKPTSMLGTFLLIMVVISVSKFAWVMRQIISVRIARAETRTSVGSGDK